MTPDRELRTVLCTIMKMYVRFLISRKRNIKITGIANLKGINVEYNNNFIILQNVSPRCSSNYNFATNY